ncbi:selenocysteine-specific translation elongation factor SelB [Malonomonas rubra DSM 5091]|uniref:Selenocysteine-specific elongation factor n=1 Tax=Malonomonas rubra DSM 5091 TaxID=1122189 RepID=A0A1M6C1P9_MALRU|nr:selenocysteine-specific translation elongation factor [Malonomonas rubra]SHI54947.1 selenocysteine-specific translation elongation factor SelB [Malonomonas rubra DSM 5091]
MAELGNFIVGTAGHVDHGKTALIGALTGTETDRLAEEKKRGISIELGFARLDLGNGQIAGVVDVPGHEKFIPQMLSGIAGIDLVLLVVDANEGVMPQTREHLQIMELLQVKRGILVLSKCDLVEPDWLDIVEEEIREQVAGTFLDKAPCCRVSSITGEGLDSLLETIREQLQRVPGRETTGAVRLPVDRCFSISGFGTVVTGTLNSGKIVVGDSLELLPAGVQARIREIQVHGKPAQEALAGQRVALNLSGVSREQVPHGSVIGSPGLFRASQRIDVRMQLLKEAPRPVKFRDPLHFHLGTARTVARAILLDRDELAPGEEAFVQLTFDQPLLSHRGDRFIIRSYSPMLTIGGGMVVDVEPQKHKRFRDDVIKRLEDLSSGNLGFWLQKLDQLEISRLKDMEKHTGTGREELRSGLEKLAEMGQVEALADQWVVSERVRSWMQQLPQQVATYQADNHLSHGIPRATLQAKIASKLAPKGFEILLQRSVETGEIAVSGDLVMTPGWQPQPTDKDIQTLDKIEQHYRQRGFQVKNQNEVISQIGLDGIDTELYFSYLVLEKKLVRLNPESYLHAEHYAQALQVLKGMFKQQDSFTLAQFRDRLDSNRKLIQALLEYFDGCKYTRRTGEERVAWNLPE